MLLYIYLFAICQIVSNSMCLNPNSKLGSTYVHANEYNTVCSFSSEMKHSGSKEYVTQRRCVQNIYPERHFNPKIRIRRDIRQTIGKNTLATDVRAFGRNAEHNSYLHNHGMSDCTSMDPTKYKSCYICPDFKWSYLDICINKTVCFTKRENNSIPLLLLKLSYNRNQVKNLLLIVDNTWTGFFPEVPAPIDLTNLCQLKRLEKFELRRKSANIFQQYPLRYSKDTFKSLTGLKVLIINFPIRDESLEYMIEPLTGLEYLELSQTFGISMKNMTASLSKVNNATLKHLLLNTFQLMGGPGFSGELNITSFLSNRIFPRLETFQISGNSLSSLLPGIYSLAPNLKRYDISINILLDSHNNAAIIEGLLHPSIEEYKVNYQGYIGGKIAQPWDISDATSELDKTNVTTADQIPERLDEKLIGEKHSLRKRDYEYVPGLVALYCFNQATHPSNISEFMIYGRYLKSLFACLLAGFHLEWLQDELFPPFRDIFNPGCMSMAMLPIGQNLSIFELSSLHWEAAVRRGYLYHGNLCIQPNQVKTFSFSHNAPWLVSEKISDNLMDLSGLYGVENFENLDFSFNKLHMDLSFLMKESPFPNLKSFIAAGNIIIMPQDFQLCPKLKNLSRLDLSYSNQRALPPNIFTQCDKLESVILSHNSIHSLSGLNLEALNQLRELDLSYNYISFLSKKITSKLKTITSGERHNLTLNLHHNPLTCGCHKRALEFTIWLIQNKDVITSQEFDKYHCTGKSQEYFLTDLTPKLISEIRADCFPNQTRVIATSIFTTLLSVAVLMGLYAIYRRRWKFWYNIYKAKQSIRSLFYSKNEHFTPRMFLYDAFVSYCADDRFWVHDVLMKTLEDQYGFKLCIHYRDFPLGGGIAETIITQMQRSREMIIVISNVSLMRQWCQFELMEALRQSQARDQTIIVIKMGTLSEQNLAQNPTAAHILDMHTYLEWSDNPNGQKLFWAKLVGKLYEDNEGQCSYRCCCPYGARSLSYQEIE